MRTAHQIKNLAFAILDARFGLKTSDNVIPEPVTARRCSEAGIPVAAIAVELMEITDGFPATFNPFVARIFISVRDWREQLAIKSKVPTKTNQGEASANADATTKPGAFPDVLRSPEICDRLNRTTYGRLLLCLHTFLLMIRAEELFREMRVSELQMNEAELKWADQMLEEAKDKAAKLGIPPCFPRKRKGQIGEITYFVLATGILSFHWRQPGGEVPAPSDGMVSPGTQAALEEAILYHLAEADETVRRAQE